MKKAFLWRAVALCGVLSTALPAAAHHTQSTKKPLAKHLFGSEKVGSEHSPESFGGYAKGCVAGAVELPQSGPTWQAMRLSRNRNWAQPVTVDYIKRLSARVAKLPDWNGLYVGDMSQPRGGPMLTGHRSHQNGLDVDIWMLPGNDLTLSVKEREEISSISMRTAKGAYVNERWTNSYHEVIKAAALDPLVTRIFIFPGAKVHMCEHEKGDRAWLRKIRPWWGHHYHFHVRLKCPDGQAGCVDQAPPPLGDGCADAQKWVDDILNPPPPDPNAPPPTPRAEFVLADLPQQCADILSK